MSNAVVCFFSLYILDFKSKCVSNPDPEDQESRNVGHLHPKTCKINGPVLESIKKRKLLF